MAPGDGGGGKAREAPGGKGGLEADDDWQEDDADLGEEKMPFLCWEICPWAYGKG
jgi:hypothetical protein